jgi:hypothetical protein
LNGYDVAQICLNGHVINDAARTSHEFNERRCRKCGAETITACIECRTPIRGTYHTPGIVVFGGGPVAAPTYCHQCGKAYPWTVRSNKFIARIRRASLTGVKKAYDSLTSFLVLLDKSGLAQIGLGVVVAVVAAIVPSRTFMIIGMVVAGVFFVAAASRRGWFTTKDHSFSFWRFASVVCGAALILTLLSFAVWRLRAKPSSSRPEGSTPPVTPAAFPPRGNEENKAENKTNVEYFLSFERLAKKRPSLPLVSF